MDDKSNLTFNLAYNARITFADAYGTSSDLGTSVGMLLFFSEM